MPAAAEVAWVDELGEVVEQAAALRAGQRGGRGRMSGGKVTSTMPWTSPAA
jgi:hypothetical protein